MKIKITVVLVLVCIACFAIAQINEQHPDSIAVSINNTTIEQRHVKTDAVLTLLNINKESLPVIMTYYDNAETKTMAKELTDALTKEGITIKSSTAYQTLDEGENPKHYNFTYNLSDTALFIKAYPKQ
ncbi:MAG: hypothetical protein JST82_03550 [Bacteroidetes bacterium]|nr:hypothetical protein [Bacteroidota bacterium]